MSRKHSVQRLVAPVEQYCHAFYTVTVPFFTSPFIAQFRPLLDSNMLKLWIFEPEVGS